MKDDIRKIIERRFQIMGLDDIRGNAGFLADDILKMLQLKLTEMSEHDFLDEIIPFTPDICENDE